MGAVGHGGFCGDLRGLFGADPSGVRIDVAH